MLIPHRHILVFLVLLIGYAVMLLLFPSLPSLGVLPPYIAVISLVLLVFHEYKKDIARRQRRIDEEQGAHQLQDLPPTGDTSQGQSGALTSSARRRNSNSSRTTRPPSSSFAIDDDSDSAASLRSYVPAVHRHS